MVHLRNRATGCKVGRAARVGRKTPPGFRPGKGKMSSRKPKTTGE